MQRPSAPRLRAHHEHKSDQWYLAGHMTATFYATFRSLIWNMNSPKIDQMKTIWLAHTLKLTTALTGLTNTFIDLDSAPLNISRYFLYLPYRLRQDFYS